MKKIALLGTTASGKSDLAHKLAKSVNAVILSLDSMCIYKELNIINAKPDSKMLDEVKYFGINLISVKDDFNVALFFNEYQNALNYAKENNQNLIITGGTGFYLKALLDGLSPKIDDINHDLSLDEIYDLMQKIDKNCKINKNDKYRLNKWYSIYKTTNEIPSEWQKANTNKGMISEITIFDLLWDKDELNKRIVLRTKAMLKMGAISEVLELFKEYKNLKALNSIGAKEIIQNHLGLIKDEDLCEMISIHTRQFAKRQRTFNKKFNTKTLQINNTTDLENAFFKIKEYFNS